MRTIRAECLIARYLLHEEYRGVADLIDDNPYQKLSIALFLSPPTPPHVVRCVCSLMLMGALSAAFSHCALAADDASSVTAPATSDDTTPVKYRVTIDAP